MLFSILLAILQRATDDLRCLAANATRIAQEATTQADALDAVIAKLTDDPSPVVVGEIVTSEPTEQRPTQGA